MRISDSISWRLVLRWVLYLLLLGFAAAIVLPNLAEGRHGGRRPSRVTADLRSLATALESYFSDCPVGLESYPPMEPLRMHVRNPEALKSAGGWHLMTISAGSGPTRPGLTTPVPYLGSMFIDPFTGTPRRSREKTSLDPWPFAYYASPDRSGWLVWSPGPDRVYDITDPAAVYNPAEPVPSDALLRLKYDPTNGTQSRGDVFRFRQ